MAQKTETLVGIEAEYFLLNAKGEVIMPPVSWERDDFPVLGEIRGDPGKKVEDTVANFIKKKVEIERRLRPGHSMVFADRKKIPLALYRKAMSESVSSKAEVFSGKIKNAYGVDISDFSDQILDKGKIQGAWASCGLHLHFSRTEVTEKTIYNQNPVYEMVKLPLAVNLANVDPNETKNSYLASLHEVVLYKMVSDGKNKKNEEKVRAAVSALSRPVVLHIVTEMDRMFFDRFAPAEKNRTKYRQKGFFELKPYGFEYRSLPANEESLSALPEIVGSCFDLLDKLNSWAG